MALVKYDPFRGFEGVVRKMQDFMSDFDSGIGGTSVERGGFAPITDVKEDDKFFYVHAEIPGMKKDDVKITLNGDNVLTVRGEKKSEEKKENESFIRIERSFGSFSRSFLLPENIKSDSIKAEYKDGVLNLTIEKTEPAKPQEKEIKIA